MRKMTAFALAFLASVLAPELAGAADGSTALIAVGSGLAIGLAALGGGIGQGLAVANTVQGISRNPGAAGAIQTPMIIGLALIESLVLFGFLIAFIMQGNL
jgi:F-type H+-transporting ATPase subunit c